MRNLKMLVAASLMFGTPAMVHAQAAGAQPMSQASQKIVLENRARLKAEVDALLAQRQRLEAQRDALLTPATYDQQKLASVLAELRAVSAKVADKIDLSTLELLGKLSDTDRSLFLASLTKTRPAQTPPPGQGR